MNNDYKRLFKKIAQIEPPRKLETNILARVKFEESRSDKIRFVFTGIATVFSLVAIVPAFQYAMRGLYQSGFYQYLSLIFSDSGATVAHWKEFALSLAESLPISETTILLAVIFAFLDSVRLAFKNIKGAFLSAKLT